MLGGSLFLIGCFIDVNDDDGFFGCIDVDGLVMIFDLDLLEFDGIKFVMDVCVEIIQGLEQSVVVEGKFDIFDELDLDIDNGIWIICIEDCVCDVDDFMFFIIVFNFCEVRIIGLGEVVSINIFVIGDIELCIIGFGDLDMVLEVDDIEVDIFGLGKVVLEGIGDELEIDIIGSGDVWVFDLVV